MQKQSVSVEVLLNMFESEVNHMGFKTSVPFHNTTYISTKHNSNRTLTIATMKYKKYEKCAKTHIISLF